MMSVLDTQRAHLRTLERFHEYQLNATGLIKTLQETIASLKEIIELTAEIRRVKDETRHLQMFQHIPLN